MVSPSSEQARNQVSSCPAITWLHVLSSHLEWSVAMATPDTMRGQRSEEGLAGLIPSLYS